MTMRVRPQISAQRHGLPVGFAARAAAYSETQAVPMRAATEREISFGPFRLLPNQRLLTKAGEAAMEAIIARGDADEVSSVKLSA
jgi:hypothetical protein